MKAGWGVRGWLDRDTDLIIGRLRGLLHVLRRFGAICEMGLDNGFHGTGTIGTFAAAAARI